MAKTAPRLLPALAAAAALIAVAAGAFATHGLADARAKDLLHIGGQYELTHALAVFACLVVARRGARLAAIWSGWRNPFCSSPIAWSISAFSAGMSAVCARRWVRAGGV